MSTYRHIRPLSQPDVYAALYNFVLAFGRPAGQGTSMPATSIVQAWQNRAHLPPDSNEYCVLTLRGTKRIGSNVRTFHVEPARLGDSGAPGDTASPGAPGDPSHGTAPAAPGDPSPGDPSPGDPSPGTGILTTAELLQATVDIDFYADNAHAQQRAQALELVSLSPLATDFLAAYGITPLYAEPVEDRSAVDAAQQQVQRFRLRLYLSYWARVVAEVHYFDRIHLHSFENAEVHHPLPATAHAPLCGSEPCPGASQTDDKPALRCLRRR